MNDCNQNTIKRLEKKMIKDTTILGVGGVLRKEQNIFFFFDYVFQETSIRASLAEAPNPSPTYDPLENDSNSSIFFFLKAFNTCVYPMSVSQPISS